MATKGAIRRAMLSPSSARIAITTAAAGAGADHDAEEPGPDRSPETNSLESDERQECTDRMTGDIDIPRPRLTVDNSSGKPVENVRDAAGPGDLR